MNKCIYLVTSSEVDGYFNVVFEIDEKNAIDKLDIGITEIHCVDEKEALLNYDNYAEMGYEMVSKSEIMMGQLFK